MKPRQLLPAFGLLLIVLVGAYLRIVAVAETVVDRPLRADAVDYYAYAYNLKTEGVYSRSPELLLEPGARRPDLPPDAVRPPGYPVFLMPFVVSPPVLSVVQRVTAVQAYLGIAVLVLSYALFRLFLGPAWALIPTALTAIAPHLVSVSTFLISESLFTVCLLGALVAGAYCVRTGRLGLAIAAGVLIALAALVRSSGQYLIVVLAVLLAFHFRGRAGLKLAAGALAGFLLAFSPWLVRNVVTLGSPSDPRLVINTLHHGMYPGFKYQEQEESFGYPYQHDPNNEAIGQDLGSVLSELRRRFAEEPVRHARWFLLGKPVAFFSWGIVNGAGDIFVSPVERSPYFTEPEFIATRSVMKAAYGPLCGLALLVSVLVWWPKFLHLVPEKRARVAQLGSVVVIYFVALHMVGAPFPRYAIPLQPLIFGLATLMLSSLAVLWRRSTPPASAG
ncbi:MAG: hypothetical protein R3200_04800 [Xanthomonadales bacterium]|nr:hypothetical protein [Xanthomonadales bacterium]